ncbi:hypothetical protein [Caudoviricetes sp.]|nr:hypothetical protein [Caudoviricetes sp.]
MLAYHAAKDIRQADIRSVINASNALKMLLWHGIEPTLKKRANIALNIAQITPNACQNNTETGV